MNVAKAQCVEVDCKKGQRNCKLKRGALSSLRTVLPDCRDSVDYFA